MWDVAGNQHGGALGSWRVMVGRGAWCGEWSFSQPCERLFRRIKGGMWMWVAPEVTSVRTQILKFSVVREEHVAAFSLLPLQNLRTC